jgi:hypothetical protein
MFHRLYPKPFTRVNEAWNPMGQFNSAPGEPYCDPMITGKSNHFYHDDIFCEFYNNIAIDIVTETVYNYPHLQITEKTLRPILQKRMFLIVGGPNSLGILKDRGFKTFDPWICEDYDGISDPFNRMEAILAEIDRLTELPLDTIQDYMLECNDILEHNRAHLLSEHQAMPGRFAKLLEEM